MKQTSFPIIGLHCAGCATRAEQILNELVGVRQASVNLATATVQVDYDETIMTPTDMARAIALGGYQLIIEAEPRKSEEQLEILQRQETKKLFRGTAMSLFASIALMLAMFWLSPRWFNLLGLIFATYVIVFIGRDFYIRAYKQARQGGMGMDTLVALSTLVAYIYSLFVLLFPGLLSINGQAPHTYFEAPVMIIAFVLLGKTLEHKAKGSTTAAIRKLIDMQPRSVHRLRPDDTLEDVDVFDLLLGDRILVRPGERIAVDGLVISGESYVDESMLTGEPIAALRREADKVYAGSINQNGSLTIRTVALHQDTLLGRIIQRVRTAQGSKAPIQRTVDRIASVFVPIILGLSFLTLILWLLLGGEGSTMEQAIISAITVLVIACPCALGLATPTAIMVGIGRAAEAGILIKDAESLEVAQRIDTVVLDKTGTLTAGRATVAQYAIAQSISDEAELLAHIGMIERRSEHPIAQAIVRSFTEINSEDCEIRDWESIPGQGVRATIKQERYFIGNERLLQNAGISIPQEMAAYGQKYADELGATPVYVALDMAVVAVLAVLDELKPTSSTLVRKLESEGITVVMLTGDSEGSAQKQAARLGITNVIAGVLPEEKADYIARLRSEGRRVAMVGDGINDSAALAEATLSIAMGTGSDIAIDTAMATITHGDTMLLPELLRLSRITVRTIHQNLFWAFIYNLIAIPLAAGAFYPWTGWTMNPMIASLAMAMSSLSVVLNSLRLKYK